MAKVSEIAKNYKQPRGGYINPKTFEEYGVYKFEELYEKENISPSIVATVIDYMIRFITTDNKEESFRIPIKGAEIKGEINKAKQFLNKINGVDRTSIINACKLVGYDTIIRAGLHTYQPVENINPDNATISNIITMLKRSQNFLEEYGPIILNGFGFLRGYTKKVDLGDADFFTDDTIWELKVIKNNITSCHTLQLYMYYLMGCRALTLNAKYNFKKRIKKIGIFNPRLSKVYIKNISEIEEEIKNEVETNVIEYNGNTIDPHLIKLLNK